MPHEIVPFHVSLLGVLLGTLAWAVFVYRSDRFEREPLKTLFFVCLIGGLLSSVVTLIMELGVAALLGLGDINLLEISTGRAAKISIMSGVVEEFAKALFTVLLIRRRSAFNEPVDGVIYAMTVALGFSLFENIGYAFQGGLFGVIARSLTATPMHVSVAAIWGLGIARARFGGGDRWVRHMWHLYLAAAGIHAAYNFAIFSYPTLLTMILVNVPIVIVTLVIARRITKKLSKQGPFRPSAFCVSCDTMNAAQSSVCRHCGAILTAPAPQPDPVDAQAAAPEPAQEEPTPVS